MQVFAIFFLFISSLFASELEEISTRIHKLMDQEVGQGKNVGAMVGIYHRGQTRYLSFGSIRRGENSAPTKDTLFEIGSISKTMTGFLLAQLVLDQKMSLAQKVSEFEPAWMGQVMGDMTLKELLTHGSGLPRYPCNLRDFDHYYQFSNEDLIQSLLDTWTQVPDCEITSRPLSVGVYSNWALGILGYVMEKDQGVKFKELMKKHVFHKLGLFNTHLVLSPENLKRLAQGYSEQLDEVSYVNGRSFEASGGVKSSVEDLIKYGKSYLIHPTKTHQLSTTIQRTYDNGTQVAYSWFVRPSGNFYHNGSTPGFKAFIKIYPKDEKVVALLTNTSRDIDCFVYAVEDLNCPSAP